MKNSRRSKLGDPPLDHLRSVAHKSPAKDIGKSTVVQQEPREVVSVENSYAFFTKQRPLSWQYYYRQVTVPFYRTGTNDEDNVTFRTVIDTLDVNEALVVNSLTASILYRPEPSGSIRPGNFIKVERVQVPTVDEFILLARLQSKFDFNLVCQSTRLYEANINADNSAYVLPTFVASVSNRDGFSTLNTNVLENAQSSTSLYALDTGEIAIEYNAIDSYVSAPVNDFAFGFLPEDAVELNGGLVASPKIVFEVHGHKLNKNDAEFLKALIRKNI